MNKKILTLGAALALTLSLAACSRTTNETTLPSGTTVPVTTAPSQTVKPTETVPEVTVPPQTTAPSTAESIPAETEESIVNP